MLKALRDRLTYANVTATLALFVALGGSSYAALKISGREIKAHTITGKNIKRNALGRRQIKESNLSAVPRALNAARLGGQPAERFLVRCPQGTIPVAGVCIETQARPPAPYGSAVEECARTDNQSAAGRRLPTHNELKAALPYDQIQLASGGELTSEVSASSSEPGRVTDLYITDESGAVGLTPDTAAGAKSYRCVAPPLN
ncbi:MAG TPA: hypothetical protein VHU14_09860 [Solirubrobacterales bacterium]|jgi:hypothetical protein|nr:hypothetical protein [Solirubrobacterales bacterium]